MIKYFNGVFVKFIIVQKMNRLSKVALVLIFITILIIVIVVANIKEETKVSNKSLKNTTDGEKTDTSNTSNTGSVPMSSTYRSLLETRGHLRNKVFGYGFDVMPTKSMPDELKEILPGVYQIVWDLSTQFSIKSTVHYIPVSGSIDTPAESAVLFHHGHSDCDCRPIGGRQYDKCAPGCLSDMPAGDGITWYDLYNVSSFYHSLNQDVFLLSMPAYGVNMLGSNAIRHNWFSQWSYPLRYYIEPCILTINYMRDQLGIQITDMHGMSGGGWTTAWIAALEPRLRWSFPSAGHSPCSLDQGHRFKGATCDPGEYIAPENLDSKSCNVYHWEQRAGYLASDTTTLYTLGALESGRHLVSLHKLYDNCCYRGCGKEDAMRELRRRVNTHAMGNYDVVFTPHHRHEVSNLDKEVIRNLIQGKTTNYSI